MFGFDWTNVHLAGAFLLGAFFATVAVLRILRAVTGFFTGVERRRSPLPRAEVPPPTEEL